MNEAAESGDQQEPDTVSLMCVECELTINPTTNSATTKAGAAVCLECVAAYYVACAGCEQFIPQDELRIRADLVLCTECYAKPPNARIQPRRAQAFYLTFSEMDEKQAIEASRCNELFGSL